MATLSPLEINIESPSNKYGSNNNLILTEIVASSGSGSVASLRKNNILINNSMKVCSDAMSHTFILSIFETIFFWSYIAGQEDRALQKNLSHLQDVVTVICSRESIKDYMSTDLTIKMSNPTYRNAHNKGLYDTSVMLCFILFLFTVSLTFLRALIPITSTETTKVIQKPFRKKWFCISYETFLVSIPPIITIGLYEVLFFQTVVKLYSPVSTEDIYRQLFNACIK